MMVIRLRSWSLEGRERIFSLFPFYIPIRRTNDLGAFISFHYRIFSLHFSAFSWLPNTTLEWLDMKRKDKNKVPAYFTIILLEQIMIVAFIFLDILGSWRDLYAHRSILQTSISIFFFLSVTVNINFCFYFKRHKCKDFFFFKQCLKNN